MGNKNLQGFALEPYKDNVKRCGCYLKNPTSITEVKPKTHVAMPLKHISYDIEVTNGLASITLEQKYLNPTEKFLEIEFSFPIDPKACIYRFVAEFGNKRVEGIVKEKEEAKKEYNEAVKQGKQAVYAEIDPNSKDIMNMEIGNVGPNEEVKISVSYLQELNIEQNTFYQFHLPATISPRYMNSDHVGKPFDGKVTSAIGEYTWSFKVTLLTSRSLVFCKSTSHELTQTSQNQSKTETVLTLAKKEKPNKDFFLLFTVEDFHLPNYVLGRTDVSSTAMLSFIPKFCELSLDDAMKASKSKRELETDIDAVRGEYIFLLDRSGSMGGTRIKKAKEALVLFLQSLPEDTYFNVVSFGSSYREMFPESKKYDKDSLSTAISQVQSMDADLGGTEIYKPLQKICKTKAFAGYPKQIFLLTDGDVSDTEGVIALVGRQVKYSRCHSIGIGNGCSEALIKGCAQKGKGKFIFIDDSENPSEKIIGLLEETLTPVIDKVSLKYDKDLVESIVPNPDSLPYILKNEVVNFYLTFKGQLEKRTSVTFGYQDSMNKVPFETVIEVDPDSPSMPFVDKMAHSRIIRNLETAAKDNKPVEEFMYYVKVVDKKKEAIGQSVKHQILSEYTAFICVSKELVDGKYEEIKDKGTDKVKIEPMLPYGSGEDINLQSNLQHKQYKSGFNVMSSLFGGMSLKRCSPPSPPPSPLHISMDKCSMPPPPQSFLPTMNACCPPPIPPQNLIQSCMKQQQLFGRMMARCDSQEQCQEDFMDELMQQCKKEKQMATKQMASKSQDVCAKKSKANEIDQIDQLMRQLDNVKECSISINNEIKLQNNVMMDLAAQSPKIQQSKKLQLVSSKPQATIQSVIGQQNIDGSFSSEQLLKVLFSKKFSEIIKASQAKSIQTAIYISYAVAKWIEKNHPQKQYALIVKKTYSYIKKSIKLEELAFLDTFLN